MGTRVPNKLYISNDCGKAPVLQAGRGTRRVRSVAWLSLWLAGGVAPVAAEDITIEFGRGEGETRYVHFDDFSGSETWYMKRCQGEVTPDFNVLLRDYGDVEQIQLVNSPLEADKVVCVIGHIPDIVKRYMR